MERNSKVSAVPKVLSEVSHTAEVTEPKPCSSKLRLPQKREASPLSMAKLNTYNGRLQITPFMNFESADQMAKRRHDSFEVNKEVLNSALRSLGGPLESSESLEAIDADLERMVLEDEVRRKRQAQAKAR